jgi:hypothetical protein
MVLTEPSGALAILAVLDHSGDSRGDHFPLGGNLFRSVNAVTSEAAARLCLF